MFCLCGDSITPDALFESERQHLTPRCSGCLAVTLELAAEVGEEMLSERAIAATCGKHLFSPQH
jgi:hypothetical protein